MQTARGIIEIIFHLETCHIPSRWVIRLEVELLNKVVKEAKYFHQYGTLLVIQPLQNKYRIIRGPSLPVVMLHQSFPFNHSSQTIHLNELGRNSGTPTPGFTNLFLLNGTSNYVEMSYYYKTRWFN